MAVVVGHSTAQEKRNWLTRDEVRRRRGEERIMMEEEELRRTKSQGKKNGRVAAFNPFFFLWKDHIWLGRHTPTFPTFSLPLSPSLFDANPQKTSSFPPVEKRR